HFGGKYGDTEIPTIECGGHIDLNY
ncbi:hypothetical protein EVA_11110, partial [gut metagenome]